LRGNEDRPLRPALDKRIAAGFIQTGAAVQVFFTITYYSPTALRFYPSKMSADSPSTKPSTKEGTRSYIGEESMGCGFCDGDDKVVCFKSSNS
jgi:hypothetical protein